VFGCLTGLEQPCENTDTRNVKFSVRHPGCRVNPPSGGFSFIAYVTASEPILAPPYTPPYTPPLTCRLAASVEALGRLHEAGLGLPQPRTRHLGSFDPLLNRRSGHAKSSGNCGLRAVLSN